MFFLWAYWCKFHDDIRVRTLDVKLATLSGNKQLYVYNLCVYITHERDYKCKYMQINIKHSKTKGLF